MPKGMGAATTGACGLGGRTGGGFCAQLGEGAKTTATEKRAMQIRKVLISRLLVVQRRSKGAIFRRDRYCGCIMAVTSRSARDRFPLTGREATNQGTFSSDTVPILIEVPPTGEKKNAVEIGSLIVSRESARP